MLIEENDNFLSSGSGIMWEEISKTETSKKTPGKEAGSQILVPVSESPSLGI